MGEELLRSIGEGLKTQSVMGQGKSSQQRAEINAAVDLRDAEIVMGESSRRAHEIMRRGRSDASAEKVRAAGAGFTQEGTSLQLQIDQIMDAEFNAKEAIRVGNIEGERLRHSARLNVRRGRIARRVAKFDKFGLLANAIGSKRERKLNKQLDA